VRSKLSKAADAIAQSRSELVEAAGLAGIAVSIGGITGDPWWGGLTGSIALVLFNALGGRRP